MKLCYLMLLTASVIASEQRQPLVNYDFLPESCENKIFPNSGSLESSSLSLLRNENTTKCSQGLGVESLDLFASSDQVPHLRGKGSIETILDHMETLSEDANNGITFSVWLNIFPNRDDMITGPIFAIGYPLSNETISSEISECNERGIDFQLSMRNNLLQVMYRTSDPFFDPCSRVQIQNVQLSHGLHHIAIALADGDQKFFLDGEPIASARDAFQTNLKHWNGDSAMHFFSFPGYNYPAWSGRIYRLSIFKEHWYDANVVKKEMARGLSESQPYAVSTRIQMNEDAESEPGSHNTEWYRTPTPLSNDVLSTQVIELPVDFVDDDVDAVLLSAHIFRQHPSRWVKFYIIKPPARGNLYQMDGTEISKEMDVITLLNGRSLVFLPRHNQYSAFPGSTYASFEYCVTKQAIFSPSQCESPGIIDIVVNPVNDPPKAIVQGSPYMVHEGIHEEPIGLTLSGKDVDVDDYITAIEITSPPLHGYLYLSVPSFREDGLVHGTLLSDLNFTVPGSEAFVEYRYVGSDQVVQGMSVKDSFQFRVLDSNGAWSENIKAEIQVVTSLSCTLHPDVIVKENKQTTFTLQGSDGSGLNRNRKTGLFFETVPNEKEGILIAGSSNPLIKHQIVQSIANGIAGQGDLNLTFQPTPASCSNATRVNVTFSYRMVAFSEGSQITSISSLVEQRIHIECNQKPLNISVPQDQYSIHTSFGSVDDPCTGYNFNASFTDLDKCTSAAIISGIQVTGHDTREEKVLVSISASNGLLTLNREQRAHTRPINGQEEMRSSIQFLVFPSKLEDVLSYLHFQTETPGLAEINITIHCAEAAQMSNETLDAPSCYETSASIHIEAIVIATAPRERLYGDVPWFSLSFALTVLCVFKAKSKFRKLTKIEKVARLDWHWRQHYDQRTGAYYYENVFDGNVTWEQPSEPFLVYNFELLDGEDLQLEEPSAHPDWFWRQRLDRDSQQFYYENIIDGTITWQPPNDIILGYRGELLNGTTELPLNIESADGSNTDDDYVIEVDELLTMGEEFYSLAFRLEDLRLGERELMFRSVDEMYSASAA